MSTNQEGAQSAQQSQSQRPSHNRNYGSGSSGGGGGSGGGGARPKPPRFQNNNYGNKPPRYQKSFNSRPPPVGHNKKPFPTNNGAVSLRNGFLDVDDSSSTNGPQCCVCYKDSRPYWSVGPCDHPVCLECTVRLRVLVSSNDCAICRASLPEVIFCRSPEPGTFNSLKESGRLRRLTFLPSYGIYLEDDELRVAFDSLLEHRCPICATSEEDNSDVNFKDFQSLQKHVQRVHSLFACDLCAQNIHLFSNERRFYTRSELATHSRKGGAQGDDKSHRGHPQCEFCDKRFFDPDALYKHLRKDHYFCHFCDADGLNHFYDAYGDLRLHFRKEHFLCEEEACKDEQFTSVFRSEIDMKAHLTAVHSRLLGRHGVKAARVIDVEFNVRPDEDNRRRRFNPRGDRGDRPDNRGGSRDYRDYREDENSSHMVRSASEPVFEPPALPKPKVDSVAEFPSLDGTAAPTGLSGTASSSTSGIPSVAQKVALASGRNVNNVASSAAATLAPKWNAKSKVDEEFPALGGGPAPTMQASKITLTNAVNFKALANATAASSAPQPQVKLPRGPRATREEEFPALGGGSSGGGGGSWGAKVKMKGTPRSLKMAPAPKIERKIQVDNDLTFVPLAVSRAKKDEENLKKLENSSKPEESSSKEKENTKKKKKKEEASQAQVLAKKADELFNGKNSASQNSTKRQGKGLDQSNFPALPEKVEKPRESTVAALIEKEKNPNVAGISVSSSSRPPPGFEKSSKSSSADLSFLRDEEEDNMPKFSQNSSSASMWVQPVEFVARSRALTEAIKSSLGGEDEGQTLWGAVMAQFKRGEVSAKEFYGLARDMFGFGDWRVLLPEVVALLPSIPKQQELARVHAREGGNNPPLLNGVGVHLVECKDCGQLLRSRGGADLRLHREVAHSPAAAGGDFPAL